MQTIQVYLEEAVNGWRITVFKDNKVTVKENTDTYEEAIKRLAEHLKLETELKVI